MIIRGGGVTAPLNPLKGEESPKVYFNCAPNPLKGAKDKHYCGFKSPLGDLGAQLKGLKNTLILSSPKWDFKPKSFICLAPFRGMGAH